MSHVTIAHADQPRFVLHQSVDARIQDCAYAARRRVSWELSCILFLARSADLEMIKFEFENQQRLEAEKLQARSLSDPHIVTLPITPEWWFASKTIAAWQLISELEASLSQAVPMTPGHSAQVFTCRCGRVDLRRRRYTEPRTQVQEVFDQVRQRTSARSSGVSSPVRSGDDSSASSATRSADDQTRIVAVHLPAGAMARAGAPRHYAHSPPGDHTVVPTMRIAQGAESRMQQAKDRWLDEQSIVADEDGRADLVMAKLTSSMFALGNSALLPKYDGLVPSAQAVRNAQC